MDWIAGSPWSQTGRWGATNSPVTANVRAKSRIAASPCRQIRAASSSFPAPMVWAVWTENPKMTPRQMPEKSQVLEATRPMEAAAGHGGVDELHQGPGDLGENGGKRQAENQAVLPAGRKGHTLAQVLQGTLCGVHEDMETETGVPFKSSRT